MGRSRRAWVGGGEIPWSQGICNLRCGTVFRNVRTVPLAGVSCETIQTENGQPHQAIIAAAEEKGCDLIVMSSHGRSGLSVLIVGSVTNKMMRHAKTPVLVVNAQTVLMLLVLRKDEGNDCEARTSLARTYLRSSRWYVRQRQRAAALSTGARR